MKKLVILILLGTQSLGAYSQKNDTICVNRADLVYKLQQVERLKVDSAERDKYFGQLAEAKNIIKSKEGIVSTQDIQIADFKLQKLNYQTTLNLQTETIKSLNKALKKEKGRRAFTTAAGSVLVMGLTYLLITK